MTQEDNWGSRARIGVFIVGNEAVPEAEWWAMAHGMPARGVSIHAARVTARAPWAAWRSDRSGVEPADDLLRGAKQFAAMRLSAVTLGHTSSSVIGGTGWDEAVIKAVSAVVGAGTIVTTNGQDTIAALKAAGVRRPFVVLPAWFGEDFVKTALGYYKDHGVAPAGGLRYDPGPKWRDLPPGELTGKGMHLEQEIEPLHAQIAAACPNDADGVLIGGTGFRCVGILDALEHDLRRPAISANQASLWHCLRLSGVTDPIAGYGSLLRT